MLVSTEPLSAILEAVACAAREQFPGSFCVILVRETAPEREGDFFVGAAPGVPPAWLSAIDRPETLPVSTCSFAIGGHGKILLLSPDARVDHCEDRVSVLARLSQIGIEHRRFLDQLSYQAHHDT
ncbi:MAG TPA: hypothetical protein VHA14_02955, partial [Bryobacteraceae bacterium]|nr:hypothetical protein [Bryobacteraceae bacterium]